MDSQDRDKVVEVFENIEALSQAAAKMFVATANSAIEANGRFTVALSGGGTPRRTYELLAQPRLRDRVRWEAVHVYWGDERCVPADDPRSNVRMARLALLDHVAIPAEQVHPVLYMVDPRESAADYDATLHLAFDQTLPRFDLVLLGMGEDGHTASLFPGTAALDETERWAAAVESKDPPRVTLTYPVLNNASTLVFLVSGANKADALQRVIAGPGAAESLPAARVNPRQGTLQFLVDRLAAGRLRWE